MQNSIWEKETFYAPNDIIIAGNGLGGLWSAYYLKKFHPKWRVLIVDKGIIPTGASTRNAGFACFGSVTELMKDAHILGNEKMLELVQMRYEGLRTIRKVLSKKQIGFKRYGGYELITVKQYRSREQLKEDIAWLNNALNKIIKVDGLFEISDEKIKQYGFQQAEHLIENKLEGQLHSGALVQALIQEVQSMGVKIISSLELNAFYEAGGWIRLHTTPGTSLTTRKLLICTNAFAHQLIPGIDIVPARGQVLVTSPISDLRFKGTFHFDEGFYYFRNIGNRILLGGARNKAFAEEETTDPQVSDTIQNELEKFLKEVVLPRQAFTIENRWSGIMGMSTSKFPLVKEVQSNCYCAVGMGGMGVAIAPVVGKQAALMIGKG